MGSSGQSPWHLMPTLPRSAVAHAVLRRLGSLESLDLHTPRHAPGPGALCAVAVPLPPGSRAACGAARPGCPCVVWREPPGVAAAGACEPGLRTHCCSAYCIHAPGAGPGLLDAALLLEVWERDWDKVGAVPGAKPDRQCPGGYVKKLGNVNREHAGPSSTPSPRLFPPLPPALVFRTSWAPSTKWTSTACRWARGHAQARWLWRQPHCGSCSLLC